MAVRWRRISLASQGGRPSDRSRLATCLWPPRCIAVIARARSPTWSARSTSSARCATRSSRTRPPRVPVRRLARHRQDVDGEDPGGVAELRERRADGRRPCGECESCRAIADATSLDVIEMDAASNNSVDDIRDLRERVGLRAGGRRATRSTSSTRRTCSRRRRGTRSSRRSRSRRRTRSSCSPRPRPTRCCRRSWTAATASTSARPSGRADRRGAAPRRRLPRRSTIPDEAVALVARSATGSFRDALGTLEQLLAYSGSTIVLEDVLAVLGAADADLLFGAVDAVAAGRRPRGAARRPPGWPSPGRDLGRFFGDLEAHARGADGRPGARRGAGRAARHARAGRAAGRAGRAASARPRSSGCSS